MLVHLDDFGHKLVTPDDPIGAWCDTHKHIVTLKKQVTCKTFCVNVLGYFGSKGKLLQFMNTAHLSVNSAF